MERRGEGGREAKGSRGDERGGGKEEREWRKEMSGRKRRKGDRCGRRRQGKETGLYERR